MVTTAVPADAGFDSERHLTVVESTPRLHRVLLGCPHADPTTLNAI